MEIVVPGNVTVNWSGMSPVQYVRDVTGPYPTPSPSPTPGYDL